MSLIGSAGSQRFPAWLCVTCKSPGIDPLQGRIGCQTEQGAPGPSLSRPAKGPGWPVKRLSNFAGGGGGGGGGSFLFFCFSFWASSDCFDFVFLGGRALKRLGCLVAWVLFSERERERERESLMDKAIESFYREYTVYREREREREINEESHKNHFMVVSQLQERVYSYLGHSVYLCACTYNA